LSENYLMKHPRNFKKFKKFILKYNMHGNDFIVKEIREIPYRIIIGNESNHLFKYTLIPRKKKQCFLCIKDLLDKRQIELIVHIKNLMMYPIK